MSKAQTIRTGKLGKKDLRLVRMNGRFFGLADGERYNEGDNADAVWRQLHDHIGTRDPKYFGFMGARDRFLSFFADGFHSDGFASRERDHKLAAKAKLEASAPLDDAVDGKGFGEAVLAVVRATSMLAPIEKARLQEVLRGPRADDFVRAAARFTLDSGKSDLSAMEQALKPDDIAKWTAVTYLPYLWRPETPMFLKPEATKDFAARVGDRFASDYEPRLELVVYRSLLAMVSRTELELSDLKPRDRIDIQSFIWVVSDYRKGRQGIRD